MMVMDDDWFMRDDEGRVLNETFLTLESGQTSAIDWTVEAWKEGRLGLTLELVNRSPLVTIPMAAIEPYEEADGTSSMVTASLSILGIVVIISAVFIIRNRRIEKWFDGSEFEPLPPDALIEQNRDEEE